MLLAKNDSRHFYGGFRGMFIFCIGMVYGIGSYTPSAVAYISVWLILTLATAPGWRKTAIVEIVWAIGTIRKLAQNLTTWGFWFFLSTKPDLENALQFLYVRGKSPQKSSALDMPKPAPQIGSAEISVHLYRARSRPVTDGAIQRHGAPWSRRQTPTATTWQLASFANSPTQKQFYRFNHRSGTSYRIDSFSRQITHRNGRIKEKRHASALELRCHRSSASADSDLVIYVWENVTSEGKMPNLTF